MGGKECWEDSPDKEKKEDEEEEESHLNFISYLDRNLKRERERD